MQTNETRNAVIHYHRSANGAITEVERFSAGGSGSGAFKPTSGQASAPNDLEGAGSVILTRDRKLLFATNGGDNAVSTFAVGEDGRLTLLDVKRTGNIVTGRSGAAVEVRCQMETPPGPQGVPPAYPARRESRLHQPEEDRGPQHPIIPQVRQPGSKNRLLPRRRAAPS